MTLRKRVTMIAFVAALGLVGWGIKQEAEAQVCYHYKWSTWPNCNVPCICDTCIDCGS
jgi:hypothetical protein